MAGRTLVFIACSLDGFIAGEDDDLSWLPQPDARAPEDTGYDAFMAGVGCLLMGRRTLEVVAGFGDWPYGDTPALVATHRPLTAPAPTVRAATGTIDELIAAAHALAGGRNVYLDGGDLIRQGLDAGLIDELIVTVVPVILGRGLPLFAGSRQRHALELRASRAFASGMVQLSYRPAAVMRPALVPRPR